MNAPLMDETDEVAELIQTLLATERRLVELTAGEVDAVTHSDGRTFLLQRAQDQLRRSEAEKQAAILNALPAHVALLDNQGIIISVNDAWHQFPIAESTLGTVLFVGVNYLEACEQAQGEDSVNTRQIAVGIRRVLEGRSRSFSLEYLSHQRSGQQWLQVTVTPLATDHANGAMVMHVNITERRLAEEQLRASEASMASAQRIAHIGSWELELGDPDVPDSNRLRWSDEMYRIAGYAPGSVEVTNQLFFLLVPPAEHDLIHDAVAAAIHERRKYSVVHSLIRPDGRKRIVRETAEITLDEKSGRPLRMIGTAHDITDKVQAVDALRNSESLFRIAGRIARLGGWSVELPAMRITWSDEVCAMHEVPPGTIPSLVQAINFYAPEWRATITSAFDACASHGTPFDLEVELVNVNGRRLWVRCIGQADRNAAGDIVRVQGAFQDITERKKFEAQSLRSQRMESIGTLAGGIAHDLNNVLAPILMAVQLLRESVTDETGQGLLSIMQSCTERGADLVKQVLAFARGVEGERILVNPSHVVRDLQKIIHDTFPKNIHFSLNPGRDLWTVTGDPTQLYQVFMNLCVNARDAMPDGGGISITMENVVLDEVYAGMNPEAKPGAFVLVKVTDTGTGIPPAIREKIFEPFFTTKEIGKGTGLGLSTTLAIIRSHGGFISLSSERDKGTSFHIYLLANTNIKESDTTVIERVQLPCGNGELVLVVDDEEGIRGVAQKTLERYGYRVILAANGAQAVAHYAQRRDEIAVVLTDMAMPVMDGPATIIALRAINPKVKIVGSSGLASHGGVAKAAGAGVNHFIPKPYTAEKILGVLALVLRESP